ncbi:hypothetical protein LL240_08590 [Oceanimonas baumannii]|uniref:hypothetical protein n=1 Tax=Oceanimonas baumannii TaxID=129578 RepID=UPI001D1927C0|nr:hypothetical protein [Oceanimonas baumannii]MCC4264514.1 hypothetical protein [Oceanimonas baumannii]
MKQAIKRLDQLPLQVLVEATIVEVSLEDKLRYGLQWYFKNSLGGGRTGVGAIGALPISSPFDGGLIREYTTRDSQSVPGIRPASNGAGLPGLYEHQAVPVPAAFVFTSSYT